METILIGNKSIATHFFEKINSHSNTELKELLAGNHQYYLAGNSKPFNRDEHLGLINSFTIAFPDSENIILDEISEGDKIVVRGILKGTHLGEFRGIKASGKKIEVTWMNIFEVLGGKIVNQWGILDSLSLMQQIGAIPWQV